MPDQRPFMDPPRTRQFPWLDLLTLDRTACKVCFAAGLRVRIVTDPATIALRPTRTGGRTYTARKKAALRRHLEAVHPDWLPAVRWSARPARRSVGHGRAGAAMEKSSRI